MGTTSFFAVMLAGLLSNNFLVGNCTGVDITTNGTNSFKTASVYSLVVFAVAFMSSITAYICNLILGYYGLTNMLFIISMVIVAMYVQMAEYVLKKVYPAFLKQTKYFVPILAGTMMLFVLGSLGQTYSLFKMLLLVIFDCLGVWAVLLLIAGIRKNSSHAELKDNYKGTVMSLIIVLVLTIIWTAF